jgi:replicative DNA helicase
MTLELEIPIIVLSQLNRSGANRRPTIDTLRESGSLEQDADNVIMLHKPDENDVEDKLSFKKIQDNGKDYVEVILAKQRNGPTGIFAMQYNPRYLKFESISRRNER